MGKMTYKRRKNVKKQSFKKRKNKKMKGGDNIEDDASVSTPTGDASAGDVTEGVQETKVGNPADDATSSPTGNVAEGVQETKVGNPADDVTTSPTGNVTEGVQETKVGNPTDDATASPTGNVAEGVEEIKVGNPEDDAYYKQFLEDLKVNPDEILRKKVYLWGSVEEFFIYDTDANKWENKRQTLSQDDDVSNSPGNTNTNHNENV